VIELLDSTPKAQTNAIRVPILATALSAEGSSPVVTVESRMQCDAKRQGRLSRILPLNERSSKRDPTIFPGFPNKVSPIAGRLLTLGKSGSG